MIKTQFGYEIQRFQSEWGGEYYNVSTYLNNHGIYHRIACTYTPEQNGLIECRNQIIIEKGMSLLAHSSLPHDYWEHAFKPTTYVHNRTITPTLNYHSPYSTLYRKEPDYGFLRSFVYLCYPFLRPYNSNKLNFRSIPCVFLGHNTSHKGYLWLHRPTSRIYISCRVIFNEELFPFSNQPPYTPSSPPIIQSNSPLYYYTPTSQLNYIITFSSCLSFSFSPTSPTSNTTQPVFVSPNTPSSSSSSISYPSHQRPTINSQAKQTSSHIFRPVFNNKHHMLTRARTHSLQPK